MAIIIRNILSVIRRGGGDLKSQKDPTTTTTSHLNIHSLREVLPQTPLYPVMETTPPVTTVTRVQSAQRPLLYLP